MSEEIEKLMTQLMHLGVYTNFKILPNYDGENNFCGLQYETYIAKQDPSEENPYHKAFFKHSTVEEAAKRFSDYITDSHSEVKAFHKSEIERLQLNIDRHNACLSKIV